MSRYTFLGDRNDQNEFDVASIESNVPARSVEGLDRFLAERYLEDYCAAAQAWCSDMGARLLEEVVEELTTLADDLRLKPLEKKRLLGPPRARPEAELALCTAAKDDAETLSTVTATELVSETPDLAEEAPTEVEASEAPEDADEWSTVVAKPKKAGRVPKLEKPAAPAPFSKWATVNVPAERVALLLANRAEALRKLEAQCGVRISVPKTGAVRAVEIRAQTPQKLVDAQAALARALAAAVEDARRFADAKAFDAKLDAMLEKTAEVHEYKTAKTVEVHESQVPVLLGERGEAVRKIEEESGARIRVPREGPRRAVAVRGSAESVSTALELIAERLPPLVEIPVRSWQVGALIGYEGATVREIEQASGARLSVPRDGEVRMVLISGPDETAVEKAKAMALEAISYAVRPRQDRKDAKDRSEVQGAPAAIPKRLQGAQGLIRGQGDRQLRRR